MVEQEPQVAPDAVTEEQDQLEQQQGALDQPQYVTADQFNAAQQQLKQMEGMLNSLQSKTDRGLNSIRAEYEQRYQQEKTQAQAQQFEQALAEVPEEQQAAMRMLWQQNQPQQPAQPAQPQGQEPDTQAVMQQAREYVRRQGLNPDDSSIDYGALFNGDAMTFADSLGKLQTQRLQPTAPAAPQQVPQTQRPREGNPSVSPAAAQSTSMNSDMDIIDARTRGEIDHQTMIERLRSIGSPLADQMQNARH